MPEEKEEKEEKIQDYEDDEEMDILNDIFINTLPRDHIKKINKYLDIKYKIIEISEEDSLLNSLQRLSSGVIARYYLVCDIIYETCKKHNALYGLIDSLPKTLLRNYSFCFMYIEKEYTDFVIEIDYLVLSFDNLLLKMENELLINSTYELVEIYNILSE